MDPHFCRHQRGSHRVAWLRVWLYFSAWLQRSGPFWQHSRPFLAAFQTLFWGRVRISILASSNGLWIMKKWPDFWRKMSGLKIGKNGPKFQNEVFSIFSIRNHGNLLMLHMVRQSDGIWQVLLIQLPRKNVKTRFGPLQGGGCGSILPRFFHLSLTQQRKLTVRNFWQDL